MHRIGVLRAGVAIGGEAEPSAHTVDLAQHHADLIDHVWCVRAEPSATLFGVRPPVGKLTGGIGEDR